jgi:hypothetical protein
VSVKKPGEFKIMNKSLVRRDAQEKVTGKAKYAGDIQLPGMLHARILRPPAHDSKLISADVSGAKQVDGVQVIKEGDFVAVLHKYPDVADAALSKIKAKFETPKSDLNDKNIFDHLLKVAPAGKVVAKEGNLQAGESGAKTLVEATYFNDYVAHSPMEPHTAVANVEGGKATVWASTQNPFTAKEEIVKRARLPVGKRPGDYPLRRRRVRRKDAKSSGGRSSTTFKDCGETGAGGVQQEGRAFLRRVPPCGGGEDQIGNHGERQDQLLGLPRLFRRRAWIADVL